MAKNARAWKPILFMVGTRGRNRRRRFGPRPSHCRSRPTHHDNLVPPALAPRSKYEVVNPRQLDPRAALQASGARNVFAVRHCRHNRTWSAWHGQNRCFERRQRHDDELVVNAHRFCEQKRVLDELRGIGAIKNALPRCQVACQIKEREGFA